jgi:hypothetical protein
MHRLTAGSCSGGPCPDITIDAERGKTGLQGYDPPPASLSPDLPATPPGEHRIEMDTDVFERLLATHLTDDALDRILAMRRERAPEPA